MHTKDGVGGHLAEEGELVAHGRLQRLRAAARQHVRLQAQRAQHLRAPRRDLPHVRAPVCVHAERARAAGSTCTLCCVGLVFCSPTTPSTGTRLTCTTHMFFGPTRNWNWRSASTKGMLSMSPTVPPSSMTHTVGMRVLPSTGTWLTRSIHSWISSVTCGTTCATRTDGFPPAGVVAARWRMDPQRQRLHTHGALRCGAGRPPGRSCRGSRRGARAR